MSSDFSKFAFWPLEVIKDISDGLPGYQKQKSKLGQEIEEGMLLGKWTPVLLPIAGGVVGYMFADRLNISKALAFYLGGGAGNLLVMPFEGVVKREFGPAPKAKTAFYQGHAGDTMAGVSGPLSNNPLRPLVGVNMHPAIPRYPFASGAMYGMDRYSAFRQ